MIDLRAEHDGDRDIPDQWWMDRMRIHRNRLLAASDWTQAYDDPTGKRDQWATYRQALRDFPATWTPASSVTFPDPPA